MTYIIEKEPPAGLRRSGGKLWQVGAWRNEQLLQPGDKGRDSYQTRPVGYAISRPDRGTQSHAGQTAGVYSAARNSNYIEDPA